MFLLLRCTVPYDGRDMVNSCHTGQHAYKPELLIFRHTFRFMGLLQWHMTLDKLLYIVVVNRTATKRSSTVALMEKAACAWPQPGSVTQWSGPMFILKMNKVQEPLCHFTSKARLQGFRLVKQVRETDPPSTGQSLSNTAAPDNTSCTKHGMNKWNGISMVSCSMWSVLIVQTADIEFESKILTRTSCVNEGKQNPDNNNCSLAPSASLAFH